MTDDEHVITRGDLHNLTNRVAVIKGYAKLLERQMQESASYERAVRRLAVLRDEIDRLEEMVEALAVPHHRTTGSGEGDSGR